MSISVAAAPVRRGIFGGVGYEAGRVGVSVGYRYLSFHQGSYVVIQKLPLGVPIITANIRF
jgi:hypothetical protein